VHTPNPIKHPFSMRIKHRIHVSKLMGSLLHEIPPTDKRATKFLGKVNSVAGHLSRMLLMTDIAISPGHRLEEVLFGQRMSSPEILLEPERKLKDAGGGDVEGMQNNAMSSEEVTALDESLLDAQVALTAAWIWTEVFVVKVTVPSPLGGAHGKAGV